MYLDQFSNPIFNETDIFNFLYANKIDNLSELIVSPSVDIDNLEKNSEFKFKKVNNLSICDRDRFDQTSQENWFIPEEYKKFDIESWIYQQCKTDIEINRVQEELNEFTQHNMINLLRWLKYFVDTCHKNKILWGVGRGSSVSSYVLYLIGVHRINSLQYQLDWKEFLK